MVFIASPLIRDIHVQSRQFGKLRTFQKFVRMARCEQDAGYEILGFV